MTPDLILDFNLTLFLDQTLDLNLVLGLGLDLNLGLDLDLDLVMGQALEFRSSFTSIFGFGS